VEAHFDPFRDSTNLDSRYVHGLHPMYHRLINHFVRTQWYFYVTRLKWKLVSVRLEIVLIMTQGRSKVYAECTIGLEIILDTPDGTPR
jgi:hypothetical protein